MPFVIIIIIFLIFLAKPSCLLLKDDNIRYYT